MGTVFADCPDGGPHAMQMSTRVDAPQIELFRSLPEAKPGDLLELSAWVRVVTETGRGEAGFATVDSGWVTYPAPGSPGSSTRNTWTRVGSVLNFVSAGYPPRISLHVFSTGSGPVTVLFDRVEVKRLAPIEKTNPVSF